MSPNTFWNINNGRRYDLGTFAEWERKWDSKWTTLLGVRNDTVWMDTGNVQGYNTSMYGADAALFNAEKHARTDINFDATALARYQADLWTAFEGGYSMKTRSPSLYERYDWSTNAMAAEMNGWAGDGNRYVGNINLKPETAHTLSVSYDCTMPALTRTAAATGTGSLKSRRTIRTSKITSTSGGAGRPIHS